MAELIDSDVNCQQCGYNLRGLDSHHRCPECGHPYSFAIAPQRAFQPALGWFGRFCAVAAMLLGIAFLIFGTIGTFAGVRLSLELPPVLGALVAVIGWGIVRSVIIAWQAQAPGKRMPPVPKIYRDPIPPSAEPIDREIDRMHEAQHFDDEAFDVLRDDPKPPAS